MEGKSSTTTTTSLCNEMNEIWKYTVKIEQRREGKQGWKENGRIWGREEENPGSRTIVNEIQSKQGCEEMEPQKTQESRDRGRREGKQASAQV
ncbi:hypothetical protein BDQ12DRAFT_684586 [Crucibulum laeve]|uniref:Uncharacterized protein n=1 Tax=Crucibulum laeve TaxID=68775 RepID=A0A5C3LY06_9AGAR|nr:hypothetical protein BDQ12DRAFT_684586 [Crucibulum laeve]